MTDRPTVGVLDGHNDLPWTLREHCGYDLSAVSLATGEPAVHTDLPRLRAGGVTGQFWSVFVPCSLTGQDAVRATHEQVDFVHALVEDLPGDLALCRTADDVDAAGAQPRQVRVDRGLTGRQGDRREVVAAVLAQRPGQVVVPVEDLPGDLALCRTADDVDAAVAAGRIASLMGMEGGHSIDSSLDVLRDLHGRGVRYMTLTHNENVPWADSATDTPVLGGLSDLGRDVVREMNRLGMFVDLSHVSDDVMRDALEVTTAPVIFSHSSARAVADHPRNVPDDVLRSLAGNGGVCMVSFVSFFVSQAWADWYFQCLDVVTSRGGDSRNFDDVDPVLKEHLHQAPPAPTVAEVADHVDHVRDVAGVEHIGLGGDYDGASAFPAGMEDVSGYPLLFDELRARGWSDSELCLVGTGNVLRAMRDMEQVARQASGPAGR